jgi:GlpG protein
MKIVGELFDKNMALTLTKEMKGKGYDVSVSPLNTKEGTIYQIFSMKENETNQAMEYFRVRMGLPGAPPEIDPEWEKMRGLSMGPLTKTLILISVIIFFTSFNKETFAQMLELLFFNGKGRGTFGSIQAGEIWRLVTPIFLHFNFMHILFNCMWIKDLGTLFENEKGSKVFLFFVLIVAIFSNTLQYLAFGSRFGGLSGLVYGLLGYLWVFGALREGDGFRLPKRDVVLMVGWYFLCLTGLIGPIANIAHGAGLAAGMVWALFPWRSNQIKERIKFILLALFFSIGTYLIEIAKINFR